MILPFEEVTDDQHEILQLLDSDFQEKYYLPERRWSWAETTAQAAKGVYEPRPKPILKSGRPLLSQGGDETASF
jgi:hypothetical protein